MKLYVLRAFWRDAQDGPVYGVFGTLEEAQRAAEGEACYMLGFADGEWEEQWEEWASQREIRIWSSAVRGCGGHYLVEEHTLGAGVIGTNDERIRQEIAREDERLRVAAEELAEWHERWTRQDANWRSLSAETKAAMRDRYDRGGVTQTALAHEYDIALSHVQRLVRGWRERRAALDRDSSAVATEQPVHNLVPA